MSDNVTFEEIRAILKESEQERRELTREIRAMAAQQKATDRRLGEYANGWGEIVEDVACRSIHRLFKKLGFAGEAFRRLCKQDMDGNALMEIDFLLVGTLRDRPVCILFEIKSRMKREFVSEHLERIAEFRKVFPEYASRDVQGGVAAISYAQGTDRYAERQGLWVLRSRDDLMRLANRKSFAPKVWPAIQ